MATARYHWTLVGVSGHLGLQTVKIAGSVPADNGYPELQQVFKNQSRALSVVIAISLRFRARLAVLLHHKVSYAVCRHALQLIPVTISGPC